MEALPRPNWGPFHREFNGVWKQGEHVFICAKTGTGKTDLMFKLLQPFEHATVLCAKPDDATFRQPITREYRRTEHYDRRSTDGKLLVMPSDKDRELPEVQATQAEEFRSTLNKVYRSRGQAMGMDELLWLQLIGLKRELEIMSFMGRAKGISIVGVTQRPKNIPVVIMQQASYAFVSRAMREDDLDGLAELGVLDRRTMKEYLRQVTGKHDFLFIDTTGEMPMQIIDTHA